MTSRERFYAQHSRGLLVVLQALDAGVDRDRDG